MALFDFDGTISLIRSGWVDVMVPMMVEILLDLKTGRIGSASYATLVQEFVWRLTGKETIYQMMEFADHVKRRGGCALDPLEYKKMYLDLLVGQDQRTHRGSGEGRVSPEQYLVPGARALLEALKERGLKMYLASGTDRNLHEGRGAAAGRGALLRRRRVRRAGRLQELLEEDPDSADPFEHRRARRAEIVGFGDGYVEIEEVKLVGGVTVGVATTEPECREVDAWKRERLIGVGADLHRSQLLNGTLTCVACCSGEQHSLHRHRRHQTRARAV